MFASRRIFNLVLALAVIGFGVAGYIAIGPPSSGGTASTTLTATKGSVLSSVSATGNASASRQISLNFQTAGTITEIDAAVGQHVDVGQILGKVTNATQQASLLSAQANLASAEAKAALDRQGETPQQRAVDDITAQAAQLSVNNAVAGVANAQAAAQQDVVTQGQSLSQAQQSLVNAQNNAAVDAKQQSTSVAQAQDAVTNAQANAAQDAAQQAANVAQAQQNVTNAQTNANQDAQQQNDNVTAACAAPTTTTPPTSTSTSTPPTTAAPSGPSSQCTNAQDQRSAAALKDQQSIQQAQTTLYNAQLAQQASALKDQQAIQQAQNGLVNAQNGQAASALKDQQAIIAAQQAITTAQNGAASGQQKDQQSLQTAQQQLANAQNSQQAAAANNAVKAAPPTDATLAGDQASVDNAMAQLDTAQTNLNQTVLTAPVAGTVATINGQVGGQSGGSSSSSSSSSSSASSTASSGSAGSGFMTLTDLTSLQVVAGFSESDAAKVQLGQAATVTFNALPNQNLQGKVSQIDVNSQTVNNVVTYNVTVSIVNPPPSLKPGMTANVSVTTAARDNVLTLPSSAVSGNGSTTTLQVQGATGKPVTRIVTVGLRGDTNVEITSGLAAGDKVVITRSTGGTSGTNSARLPGGFGGGGGLGGVVVGGGGGGGGGGGAARGG